MSSEKQSELVSVAVHLGFHSKDLGAAALKLLNCSGMGQRGLLRRERTKSQTIPMNAPDKTGSNAGNKATKCTAGTIYDPTRANCG
jgi:hypothetical protein